MIKYTFCLFAFVFCLHSIAIGQRSTYVGAVGALTFDKYEFTDPGDAIRNSLVPSGAYGVLIGQEISDHFVIELGLIRKHYSEGIALVNPIRFGGPVVTSYEAIQLPVRLKSRFKFFDDKVILSPFMGFSLSVNTQYGYGMGNGGVSFYEGEDVYMIEYLEDVNKTRVFPLIESGISIDFQLAKDIFLSTQFSYFGGLEKVSQTEYKYQVNDGELSDAYAHSNGSYLGYGLALYYRFSKM